jgi:DNA-binding transcriptional regulator YhcF (GntR family)
MKLKLKKEIIENKNISNNAFMTYIGIVSCYKRDFDFVFSNKNMINYYMTKKIKISKKFDENIRNGMKELFEKEIIICNGKIGSDYYLGLQNIQCNDNDKFTFVDFSDIQTIMSSNYKGKSNLLRFYICLLGTFISKNHIKDIREPEKYNNILGMMSQEYLAGLADVSVHTVVEYTKALEELGLIYVSRCSFVFKDSKGRTKRHNNIYGKYKDRELIDEFAKIRYAMYDDLHKVQSANKVNNDRSLMQKYNCLRNNTDYDKETVTAIYNYVCEYNKKHPKKAKDMTPFVKYGYKI